MKVKINNRMKTLILMGIRPQITKDEIIEESEVSRATIDNYLYDFQRRGLALRLPDIEVNGDEDKDHYQITGKGKQEIEDFYKELEKHYHIEVEKPPLEAYKPRHARQD